MRGLRAWATAIVSTAAVVAALLAAGPALARGHRVAGLIADLPTGGHMRHATFARAASLGYEGGPVLHWNRTHLVFWAPGRAGLSFEGGYQTVIERFLSEVAADSHRPTNVYSLSGQYRDGTGPAAYDSVYGGAVTATDRLPGNQCREPATGPGGWTRCLTDAQLQSELERVVAAHRLPRTGNDVYFLVLPDGLASCTDSASDSCALGGSATGYCGYHSETQDGLIYAVIPYNAVPGHCQSGNPRPNGSAADPAISTISHEHNEAITDPETYNSWIDPSGNENGDLCITAFGPALGGSGAQAYDQVIAGGHYWLQEEWSNEDNGCMARDEPDPVTFGVPGRLVVGHGVALSGQASDPDGRITAYDWFLGDGATSHRRAVSHAFARSGTYRITLRVTDSAGNWAWASRSVRVLPAAAREPRRRTHGKRVR